MLIAFLNNFQRLGLRVIFNFSTAVQLQTWDILHILCELNWEFQSKMLKIIIILNWRFLNWYLIFSRLVTYIFATSLVSLGPRSHASFIFSSKFLNHQKTLLIFIVWDTPWATFFNLRVQIIGCIQKKFLSYFVVKIV